MNKKQRQYIWIAVAVVAAVLVFSPEMFTVVRPLSTQYEFLDVDVSSTRLPVNNDTVNVQVAWTHIKSLDSDYKANAFIWIYVNDEFYQAWSDMNQRGYHNEMFEIRGLDPGWNEIKVKVGLTMYDLSIDCSRDDSISCNFGSGTVYYNYKYQCPMHEYFLQDQATCDLLAVLYGQDGYGSISGSKIEQVTDMDYSPLMQENPQYEEFVFTESVYREKTTTTGGGTGELFGIDTTYILIGLGILGGLILLWPRRRTM